MDRPLDTTETGGAVTATGGVVVVGGLAVVVLGVGRGGAVVGGAAGDAGGLGAVAARAGRVVVVDAAVVVVVGAAIVVVVGLAVVLVSRDGDGPRRTDAARSTPEPLARAEPACDTTHRRPTNVTAAITTAATVRRALVVMAWPSARGHRI